MAQDAALLADLDPNWPPILHFYDWVKPSLTYGYFIDIKKYLHIEKLAEHKLDLARRPTGGGIVFHIWDLAFSFLMPAGHPQFCLNTLDNYRFVNEIVLDAVVSYFSLQDAYLTASSATQRDPSCNHFCMARPTIYDAVFRGMKVAGAAQRRTKKGFLHQGTISLTLPQIDLLEDILCSKEEVVRAMQIYTFAPLEKGASLQTARADLKKILHQKFLAAFEQSSL